MGPIGRGLEGDGRAPAAAHVMDVSNLWLYPLKGGAGVAVSEWPLDAFGLLHDRRWMVVDGDGVFVSQRGDAALGQVRQTFEPESLLLQSASAGECRIPLATNGDGSVRVRIWADEVAAVDCGSAAAAFITRHLGRTARIVHMPESTLRPVPAAHARNAGRVSFADAFPLLMIGDGSLAELNGRLDEPIEMLRFRPNIVVSGVAPHGEDAWRRVRIGEVELDVVKPCARCAVPTIDPVTGVAGREPTRTLAGYRRWDGKVWFGQNAIHRSAGTLVTGTAVTVLEAGDPDPPLLL